MRVSVNSTMQVKSSTPPPTDQSTASHTTLDPIPATTLAHNETQRRETNLALGLCKTACPEIDSYVLLQGGFERGSVVGVSAEKEDFAVTLAMQVLAQGLKDGKLERALIVTPRPKMEVLRPLRAALDAAEVADLKGVLEGVELAQVFDVDGVWEVLADLDRAISPGPALRSQASPVPTPEARVEIGDSEDEDEDALSSPERDANVKAKSEQAATAGGKSERTGPDLIIITHFSSLLSALFTARQRPTAHTLVQHLSSHIRHLTRTLPSSPLTLILNSTTSPGAELDSSNNSRQDPKPLDPTHRSIFNPPVIPGLPSTAARRNKPSFGSVFAQMLDVHLLCTRLPKSKADADEVHARGGVGRGTYVTVVEVLLDELGVWEKGARRFREQRWAPVEVRGGLVVDAFEKGGREFGEVRLAAGFGGPRV